MLALNTLAIGAASFFAVVVANHGHQVSRAHHHNPLIERSEAHLQKRFGGQATYYIAGQGACGIVNSGRDFIVALNSAQYGGGYPGPQCFKSINICKGSKCHHATITDECPTCDYGSLDLSEDLFKYFAPTSDGVFQMTWSFADGNDDPPKPTEKPDPPKPTEKPDPPKPTEKPEPPKPTPKPEPEPEPTTTSKKRTSTKPATTSTPEPTTSTTTSTSSVPTTTSTSEAVSTSTTTSATTSSASPTASVGAGPVAGPGAGSSSGPSGSNWVDMAQVMLAMGRLAHVANSN